MTVPPDDRAAQPGVTGSDTLLQVIRTMPQAMACFDADDRLRHWNDAFLAIHGLTDSTAPAGLPLAEVIGGALDRGLIDLGGEPAAACRERLLALHRAATGYEQRLADGRWLQVGLRRAPDGCTVGLWIDITALKTVALDLARKHEILTNALDTMSDGVSVLDRDLRLIAWNARYGSLNGYPDELLREGTPIEAIYRFSAARGDYPSAAPKEVRRRLARARGGKPFRAMRSRANGMVLEVRGNPTPCGGFVVSYTDVTQRERASAAARHQATHDPLTGLANRTLFRASLEAAVRDAARGGTTFGVLLFDLDAFKEVNDAYGQGSGDRLLCRLAHRLAAVLGEGDLLARLDGDEFAALVRSASDRAGVAAVLERLTHAASRPFRVGGQEMQVTLSLGASLFPLDAADASHLLRCADIALQRGKEDGRGRWRFFEASQAAALSVRRGLLRDLRGALRRGELGVVYQPQFDARTLRPYGAEALVRWTHPERGAVTPATFVPLAEDGGLIGAIDGFVLAEACRTQRLLGDEGVCIGPIAVNVSSRRLHEADLVDDVARALRAERLEPRDIAVEITETAMMKDMDGAIERLQALRRLGIEVAIDDFGAGWSSFSYLRRLPASRLKIDRSFVASMDDDPRSESVVAAIVEVGHGLGMRVVAEGVETETQASRLVRHGCDSLQGFLLGRPTDIAGLRSIFGR